MTERRMTPVVLKGGSLDGTVMELDLRDPDSVGIQSPVRRYSIPGESRPYELTLEVDHETGARVLLAVDLPNRRTVGMFYGEFIYEDEFSERALKAFLWLSEELRTARRDPPRLQK